MSRVTEVSKEVGEAIGATEYGMLLLSAFPDQVLADAHASYKAHKGEDSNAVAWLWSHATELCKKRSIKPYYDQMLIEVNAAGYRAGDKLLLFTDPESQHRYNDPKVTTTPPLRAAPQKPNGSLTEREALEKLQSTNNGNHVFEFIKNLKRSKLEHLDNS